MEPKISIIMGVYNCEKTLSEALDSIIDQTYTQWKLIICDDCSTDNSVSIIESYVSKYPNKIVFIRNEKNQGLNFTLNHCLEFVDTEYVARMDGDDISLPERLEKEIDFLETNPDYAIVSCPMIYFDESGDFGKGNCQAEPKPASMVSGPPFCHAPCLVRAEAYRAVNGYKIAKNRLRVEDWDLWIRMYSLGYKGYNLSEHLYKMRDDRNAIKRRKFKYRLNEFSVGCFAVKEFNLNPINYIKCLRSIILGLLPKRVYVFLHKIKIKSL